MTVKERVYASRIIEKADKNTAYAEVIGLSCKLCSSALSSDRVAQDSLFRMGKAEDKPNDVKG